MNYPGGKNGAGVSQFIISRMPPHRFYIEGFLGSGAILRRKRPAEINIGIDRDPQLILRWRSQDPRYKFEISDFVDFMNRDYKYYNTLGFETMIYLDPPYLKETRKSKYPIYQYEMDRDQHERLLKAIINRNEYIMISGYNSDLYRFFLADWRVETFQTMTRGGSVATEHLWMNYPEPTTLHDYRYLGIDRTDRQRIKRKIERQIKRLDRLDRYERQAILISTLANLTEIEREKIVEAANQNPEHELAKIKITT